MSKIELMDGKYTVVNELEEGGGFRALRYGEEWRNLVGDNLVLSMAYEIEELREELRKRPCIIPLSQGKVSLVDSEDFETYSKYKWYSSHGYAKRSETVNGESYSVFLHREIMGNPEGKVVDHINGDRADNRRENLRICTQEENFLNSKPNRGKTSSKYKGVSWHKSSGKWHARTSKNRRRIHIGAFDCEKDAARAYNKKVEELFGEYAYQNFIEGDEYE